VNSRSTAGIALINALIIVAAISAVSIALLIRSEQVTHRLTLSQDSIQADQYLGAVEILIHLVLDRQESEVVHLNQGWASPRLAEPIDRGKVSWTLKDLQGRFNVNRMIGEDLDAAEAREAFYRLILGHGFSPGRARLLIDAFSSSEARREAVFGNMSGESLAPPLPLRDLRELGLIPGLQLGEILQLSSVATTLPPETALNVNAVVPEVLFALLSGVDEVFVDALEARQANEPFKDVGDFVVWARQVLGNESENLVSALNLSVDSEWFEATVETTVGLIYRKRILTLNRSKEDGKTTTLLSWSYLER